MAMLRLLWVPGIVVFLVIAAPWFVLMQERFEGFMHYFFVVQHFQRYSQATFNNPQPFWFYVAVLLVLALPWTPWLAGARKLQWRGPSQPAFVRRLMLVWLVSITLFFSLPHSKLVGYIFPVVAPMLFLAADAALALRTGSSRWTRTWRICAAIAVLTCLVLEVVFVFRVDPQTEIGRVLRERVQPGDTVIALEEYRFAIPFEARLRQPIVVVADWSPQEVVKRDNWRKELADAAAFAPHQDWLISEAMLPARICQSRTSWLIGTVGLPSKYPWLAQAERVASSRKASSRQLVLWRVDASSPVRPALCPGTPSASSEGK